MKLLSVKLTDFRQFRGAQNITFAQDEGRNTTLVYGPNGGGKTTLLNAFIWTFYGSFTDDFEQPERIIHDHTWAQASNGARLSASVEVQFERDGRRYEAIRTVEAVKDSPQQMLRDKRGTLRVLVTDRRGTTEPKNPADLLDRLLPERLHRFFFFNGERIENLTKHSAYKDLSSATRTLLGLDVLTRSMTHLPQVAKAFERELGDVGDAETQVAVNQLEELETSIKSLGEEMACALEETSSLADLQEAVFRELGEHREARVHQNERNQSRRMMAEAEKNEADAQRELRRTITKTGFVAFTETLGDTVAERLSELEHRGELPAPLKEPFIRELLERGRCICGEPLTVGTTHRAEVEAFLSTAGSPELEAQWMRLEGHARRLKDDRVTLMADVTRGLKQRDRAIAMMREAEEIESEVSKHLQNYDDTVVQGLEERQRQIASDIASKQQRLGRLRSDLDRAQQESEKVRQSLRKLETISAEAALARRRAGVAREAAQVLRDVEAILTEGVRRELNERITSTYSRISARARTPELSPTFELRLYETDSAGTRRQAPNSTGENTVLALSFVGGLVSYARDQSAGHIDETLKTLVEGRGGVYPIVIDAAFGNLDESYRLEVARALPKLATQLIALLSKAQAAGAATEFANQLGRRYVMVSYVAKADRDEDIVVDGHAYPYRRVCEPHDERTEIEEIT